MNLVDSCGWLEYFADGPNAEFFAPALEDKENLLVPSICIFEVFKRILGQRDERSALQAAALMQQGRVAELSSPIALAAAKISVRRKIPLADSVILATADTHDALIWTQDVDFKDMENVRYVTRP